MPRINRLNTLVVNLLTRRKFIQVSTAMAASGLVGGCGTIESGQKISGGNVPAATPPQPLFAFKSVPVSLADTVVVAEGYSATPFFLHGDPVSDGPVWKFGAANSADEAMLQGGQMHDGMCFFPLPQGVSKSDHGLLVMNHEYPRVAELFPDGGENMTAEKVRKMHATVGVSVLEVKLEEGNWQIVRPSKYARRVHGLTATRLSGPAAGAELMKSQLDPTGRVAIGTMANCGMGTTPWGTYLTCEEYINSYFSTMGVPITPMQRRYQIRPTPVYAHPNFDARYDASKHPQEFHKVGWVVEIDPYDPTWIPAKRTAIGRCFHESAHYSLANDGRVVIYTGDDSRFEYVYKFVSRDAWNPNNRAANRDLLDHGTLYVARFDADGKGRWIALVHGQNGLTAANGFLSQAEVVTFARAAADQVGATKCDRPEWIVVHPQTREVYASFTGNRDRGKAGMEGPNAANPRANNLYGHIVRWREDGNDAAAEKFDWDVFVSCGDPQQSDEKLRGTVVGDLFTNPDGLTFDYAGRLWACTDTAEGTDEQFKFRGNDAVIAINHLTGESKRFLVGPVGAEVTGLTFAPDMRTAWVNVQHPTKNWPNTAMDGKPRSATLVIRKRDGGLIGS